MAKHSRIIVEEFNKSGVLPFEVVWKPTLITNELIRKTFNEANTDEECAGVITWMHTFSPAKSWILGLQEYRKPLLHLHTQFNEEIPYDTIDMDFMNENQAAHGDREYGHIVSRMGIERKVVMGHWSDRRVQERIEIGFERFLEEKNYQAIVTHFGDLGALKQLPGLADPEAGGKGLRLRRGRRLESGGHGAYYEADDNGYEGREGNLHAGGLYL